MTCSVASLWRTGRLLRAGGISLCLRFSRNESRNTGRYNRVESILGLDFLVYLLDRAFRKAGKPETFLDAAGILRGGQDGRTALHSPGEQNLSGRLVDSPGNCGDHWIVQQPGFHRVT